MGKKQKPDNRGFVYSTDPGFRFEEENPEQEAIPTAQQPLKVRLDTKHRAGKAVTVIEGFQGSYPDLEQLGKQLKSYCGTGGSVKDRLIMVQGDQRDKVIAWLFDKGYKKARKI